MNARRQSIFKPFRHYPGARLPLAIFFAGFLLPGGASGQSPSETPSAVSTPAAPEVPPPQTEGNSAVAVGRSEEAPPANEMALVQADGRIRMQFKDQSWLAALQWLAQASGKSLDWQRLPEDRFNLVTQNAYTLDEARDLFNMQLMARGYTLLLHGELLSVLPLEKINPALLPRVTPDELERRDSHEFARVTFPLQWLVAEKAAKEAGPLLSAFGKATPLEATNQLDVYDAVINLRSVKSLLQAEQSNDGRERLVVEFPLQYARAEDVVQKLRELLGVSSRPRSRGPQVYEELRLDLEKTKVQAEAIQKLGQEAKQLIAPESSVHFAVDEEKNIVLCNASPDKIELVRQAIKSLDRPDEQPLKALQNVQNVKLYSVEGADVDAVRDMLEELKAKGNISANTWFDIEVERSMLIASATPEEHLAIASFISRYLPEERSAEVIALTVLEPQYAAQAIRLMLQQNQPSRASAANRWRLEVDDANQRLLIWGSAKELQEMRQLLSKLGEPYMDGDASVRSIQLSNQDWEKVRGEFELRWRKQSQTPLQFDQRMNDDPLESSSASEAAPRQSVETSVVAAKDEAPPPKGDTSFVESSAEAPRLLRRAAFNQLPPRRLTRQPSEESPPEAQQANATPMTPLVLTPGSEGKLIISSQDSAAVSEAERLLKELAPTKPNYEVFPLKHALAYSVSYRIEEVMGMEASQSPSALNGLSPAKKMKLVADYQTNTLLVQNATEQELERVRQLLELYDRPHSSDKDMAREQRVIVVHNIKAEQAAETLKEVYRDLLSSNDKTFDARQINTRDPGLRMGYAYSTRKEPQYQGMLSVGIDAKQNAVIVSAPGFLIEEVATLLAKLDSATGERQVVVRAVKGVDSDALRLVLGGVTGRPIPEPRLNRTRRMEGR